MSGAELFDWLFVSCYVQQPLGSILLHLCPITDVPVSTAVRVCVLTLCKTWDVSLDTLICFIFIFRLFCLCINVCALPFPEYLHVPDSHTKSVCHPACQVCFLETVHPPTPHPRADITATYELLHICLWIRSAPDAACNGTLPPFWKPKWNFPLPVSLLPPSSPPNHLCPALGGACRDLSRQDINGPVLQSEGLTQPCFTVASPWRTGKKLQSLLGERCCFFF